MKEEIAWLKECFPLGKKVRVWFVDYKQYHGTANETDDYFLIKIAKRLDHGDAVFALVEEWSHCLTFDTYPEHSKEWGDQYAKIIRAYNSEE